MKGAQSKPNFSPNAFPKLCEWIPTKREGDAHGSLFDRKILMKSPEPGNKAQSKVDYTNYYGITMRRNYYRKFSVKIMSENYDLVYQSRRKCEIYRDTGISKNTILLCFITPSTNALITALFILIN